ncbi:hypothetical protein Cgig2_026244 [Carnegiea gigantea]|uniref:phosphoribosylaminoimidazole carboxylase n=1 Tax=Carnegiea gigantea TaxID=171969 RepID=A0A9Q1QIH9_9CARY|nr:hypothetical protein Cgig2_026244 [Carnegiea gigantea]
MLQQAQAALTLCSTTATAVKRASFSRSSTSLGFSTDFHFPPSSSLSFNSDKRQSPASFSCKVSTESPNSSIMNEHPPVHGVSDKIVGVLGGGQLGRMLCEAASELAIKVVVLDPMENCPASSLAHDHMVGSFDDSANVQEFAKRCGVLTVEIEHVDAATLDKLERQGVDCQPKASTIRIIQIEDLESAERAGKLFDYPLMIKSRRLAYDGRGNAVAKCEEDLSSGVSALGGYERGLYVEKWAPFVKSVEDATSSVSIAVTPGTRTTIITSYEADLASSKKGEKPVLVPGIHSYRSADNNKIDYQFIYSSSNTVAVLVSWAGFVAFFLIMQCFLCVQELAVVVARGRDNSVLCYPVVETIHKENICHIVKAPASVPWKIRKLASDVAYKAVSSLEGAGVFAVELFLTGDGQILLNEVAPRPHNSGHHTIESCYTSQFEQHLRAVVGLPLGDPSMKTPSAIMYNILGEEDGEPGFFKAHQLMKKALSVPGASVHWYDKSEAAWTMVSDTANVEHVIAEMKRQRKMGHITIVGSSMNVVEAKLKSVLEEEKGDDVNSPQVGIIMGSDSDLPVMKDAARILNIFGVPHEVRIVSAHRTPELMFSYATSAAERGVQVVIAGAGGAAHLPGMVAALTPLPVIGVPVRASSLDGLDSLLSIVQMPRGVPVATVAINNATNAALLAVRMLGAGNVNLRDRMAHYLEDSREEVLAKTERLEKEGWEAYLNK